LLLGVYIDVSLYQFLVINQVGGWFLKMVSGTFLHFLQFRNVCLKKLFGVLSAGQKCHATHVIFTAATPQVIYWAYISAINNKNISWYTCASTVLSN